MVKQQRNSSTTTWRLPSGRWWRTSRVIIVSTISKSPWNTSFIEIFVICQSCLRKYNFSIIIPPTDKIMCMISVKICVQTTIPVILYNKHDFKLQVTHRRRHPPTPRAPAPSTATSTRRVRTHLSWRVPRETWTAGAPRTADWGTVPPPCVPVTAAFQSRSLSVNPTPQSSAPRMMGSSGVWIPVGRVTARRTTVSATPCTVSSPDLSPTGCEEQRATATDIQCPNSTCHFF